MYQTNTGLKFEFAITVKRGLALVVILLLKSTHICSSLDGNKAKAKQSKAKQAAFAREEKKRGEREMGLKFAGRKGGRQMKCEHAHIVCPAHLFSCYI
jgi:hypothetical protein